MLNKRRIIAGAKLLLGVGLITVLLRAVDIQLMLERFRAINIAYLLLVLLLPHVGILLSTIKWKLLLDALRLRAGTARLFSLYMIGTFFSNFLPTMVGGDAVRSYLLQRDTGDAPSVLAATFMERFIGLAALVSLLPLISLQRPIQEAFPMLNVLVIGATVGYLSLVALLLVRIGDGWSTWFGRSGMLARVSSFLAKTHTSVRRFASARRALAVSYVISLVFYLVTVATTWIAAKSLGVDIAFLFVLAVVPAVLLAGSAPVSLNGLGITEAGYVILLQLGGATPEEALATALVLRMRLVVSALLGGILFLCYPANTIPQPAPEQVSQRN